jgi:TolB-like protein/DNA-binding winged helix-turn-helix (wHTH) protein/lipoprotein NlpI
MDQGNTDNSQGRVFGQWRFHADTGDLHDGTSTTRLEPQVAKLLEHFLANQHKVISRDELITAVWKNRAVSDDAINRCVSILRHILSPEDKHAFIETVVRKGYIAHFPPSPAKEKSEASPVRRRKVFVLLACFSAALVALYYASGNSDGSATYFPEQPHLDLPMVAVLPFTVTEQGSDNEFFAHGMHDDLLTQLAKLQSMRVISRTSVMEYRDSSRNLRKIGQELGADVILEGRVQIVANRIRINAQLIDARTDTHLWAESYNRELSPANIFEVQSEIASTIADAMNTTLTAQDKNELSLIPTENMAAYLAYHRAMEQGEKSGAAYSSPEYLEGLELAVELDPNFSRAWAELVSALAFQNFSGDRPDMTLRAEQALLHLKSLAPGSADHLFGQATYLYYTLRDYDRAHDIISQALAMNPSNIRIWEMKSLIERRQGDYDAYLDSRREAVNFDPRNPSLSRMLLTALIITHRFDEARAEIEALPVQSFTSSSLRQFLLYRDHRDLKLFQQSMQDLCQFYTEPDCGWEAHIANRDYAAALASLDEVDEDIEKYSILRNDQNRMFTYWLMQADELLAQELPRWQEQLERDRAASGFFHPETSYIASATLAGIQGDVAQSERFIERWQRNQPLDWAERTNTRHEACRVLGMIAATRAAVQCIRDGLGEASFIAPFFEPYLPFYDSLRDEPAFFQMLLDIDGQRPAAVY